MISSTRVLLRRCPPSYLSVWFTNVPNEGFQHDTYQADVRYVLAHLFNETMHGGGSGEWVEVNGLKWLFDPAQKWTSAQAHNFASEAWDYVGFE